MTPERWQQIHDVLEKALELPPGERSAFLNRACSTDPSLRQEVETLLASSDDVRSSFLQSSTLRVTLRSGTKLGEYEVKSLVGSGGMGEVYRARDSRLGRDVAIKVLPSFLSSDSDRLRRFEQEARAAAALNHPNILAVFQMGTYEGTPYLVSELLEGETLREQIKRGRLSVHKAIDYAVQIARGLAAAHEKGIVHRDLKPENLFVTKDGRVKILDFGLAKLTQQSSSEHSALTLAEGTEAGVVMGTVGYMSPEQVRGQAADNRADIFAFGAILYEMLAGKRAFQKPTSPETMTAILNEDPPGISQVVANIPPALQRMVHRCLEKNPEQRFQSASDLAFALDALSDSGSSSPAKAANVVTGGRRWKIIVSATATVLALSIGGYFVFFHHKARLTDKDTIVLADFANSTGDAIFDDALKTALTVSLQQSPFLSVLPDSTVAKTLQLMTRPASTKLTPEVTRELCQRAGSKAYISGSIGNLGSEYVLGLKVINCQNGDTLAQEQVTAASKEKVLDALGEAAAKLRGELGESLATVKKYDVPLAQATTSSLEALKAYSLGGKTYPKNAIASVPYVQRAIELDPNFAEAYSFLGLTYSDFGETSRAQEYLTKAYQLRDRSTERERILFTATYYLYVTGELDKAEQALQEGLASYPQPFSSYGWPSFLFAAKGEFERAANFAKAALRQRPDALAWYPNLARYDYFLNRFDEAQQVVHEALARGADDDFANHWYLYLIAFQRSDFAAMAEQQRWFAGRPDEHFGLSLASGVEGYEGRVTRMREVCRRAADSALRVGQKENAATYLAGAAAYNAMYGNTVQARKWLAEVLKMEPNNPDVEIMAGLVLAKLGEQTPADSLAQNLAKRYPADTQLHLLWLPAIRAQLALNHLNPALAISDLQAALPTELGDALHGDGCHPWIYLRGEAYLAAGNGSAATAEFQKLLDHPGLVDTCYTRALAHLGVARANALQSKTSQGADADAARTRALAAYKDFLTLWKDADPDIPILKEAKAEYAKLQ